MESAESERSQPLGQTETTTGKTKCNSRESASASRHTRRRPSAKEKHCPWLKQAVSVPTMGVYHPRPTRSSRPTRRPNRTRRALASWRCPDPPRRFSCLSPAVLTARCHATPSPPSLRPLPQKVPRSSSEVPRSLGPRFCRDAWFPVLPRSPLSTLSTLKTLMTLTTRRAPPYPTRPRVVAPSRSAALV